MGKRLGTDGAGRYEKGGQQVASLFAETSDNEKIKAVYGNYGFWAWLRYWFLDTENYITWMLMDKGYYDYDYTEPTKRRLANKPLRKKSEAEMTSMLRRFGFATKLKTKEEKPLSPDQLQKMAMEQIKKKDL